MLALGTQGHTQRISTVSDSQGKEDRDRQHWLAGRQRQGEMGWQAWLVGLGKGYRGKETRAGCVVRNVGRAPCGRRWVGPVVLESQGREHRFKGEMSWQPWIFGLGKAGFLVWEDRVAHSHQLHSV